MLQVLLVPPVQLDRVLPSLELQAVMIVLPANMLHLWGALFVRAVLLESTLLGVLMRV